MVTRPFFANSAGEIQKVGSAEDWWWIPGDLNVADIITKCQSSDKFFIKRRGGKRHRLSTGK